MLHTYPYIYIIYTPNLGLEITLPGREREQGRFRGSSEGARGRSKGASKEHEGALREHRGSRGSAVGQCRDTAAGSLNWLSSIRL